MMVHILPPFTKSKSPVLSELNQENCIQLFCSTNGCIPVTFYDQATYAAETVAMSTGKDRNGPNNQ